MAKQEPLFMYVMWPESGGHYQWTPSVLDGIPHMKIPMVNENPVMEEEFAWLPGTEMFAQNKTKCLFDVMINGGRMHLAPLMKRVLDSGGIQGRIDIPLVNFMTTVIGPGYDKIFVQKPWYERSFVNSGICDAAMLSSRYNVEQLLAKARLYLSGGQLELLRKRAFGYAAIDFDSILERLPKYEAERKARHDAGRTTLLYAGDPQSAHCAADMLKIWHSLKSRGRKIDFRMKTQRSHGLKWHLENIPQVDMDVDRMKFVDQLGDGDIALCLSVIEGSGIAFFEQVVSGMSVIFLERRWHQEWVPKDYKLLAQNLKEAEAMVDWAMTHREEAAVVADGLRKHVLRKMDAATGAVTCLRRLKELVEEFDEKTRGRLVEGSIADLVRKALDGADEITEQEVYARMQKASDSGMSFWNRADVVTRACVRKIVMLSGYVDTCQEEVAFVKE